MSDVLRIHNSVKSVMRMPVIYLPTVFRCRCITKRLSTNASILNTTVVVLWQELISSAVMTTMISASFPVSISPVLLISAIIIAGRVTSIRLPVVTTTTSMIWLIPMQHTTHLFQV